MVYGYNHISLRSKVFSQVSHQISRPHISMRNNDKRIFFTRGHGISYSPSRECKRNDGSQTITKYAHDVIVFDDFMLI